MRKIDIIKAHQKEYREIEARLGNMQGIERAVAENLTMPWLKAQNWIGGGSPVLNRGFAKLEKLGYSYEEADAEFWKQIKDMEA